MSTGENLVLAQLRHIRATLADVVGGIDDLKYRVSSLEQQSAEVKTELAHLRADLAHYALRQDQQDRRLRRAEQRLELRDDP